MILGFVRGLGRYNGSSLDFPVPAFRVFMDSGHNVSLGAVLNAPSIQHRRRDVRLPADLGNALTGWVHHFAVNLLFEFTAVTGHDGLFRRPPVGLKAQRSRHIYWEFQPHVHGRWKHKSHQPRCFAGTGQS